MLKKKIKNRGFTFLELIIVVAIIIILASVSIGGFNEYQNRAVLNNLAQDMSLSIRLAQTYGLNVRGQGSDDFEVSYGIHFTNVAGNDRDYYLFRDLNRGIGGYLDDGLNRIETFTLNGGYRISNVCAVVSGGATTNCFVGGSSQITDLHIAFDRPKPDAHFRDNNTSTNYQSATITISDTNGAVENITVLATGYISSQ